MTFFDYPFHLDGRGRSAEVAEDGHVRDMIHQVLFTAPGEHVNRPDFGCGLKQMVFQPNSDALAGTAARCWCRARYNVAGNCDRSARRGSAQSG